MKRTAYLKSILTKEVLESTYSELRTITAMAKRFNTTKRTIVNYMDSFGLKHEVKAKYRSNESLFSTDTEISFYLAGFIAADGCIITKGNSKLLSFGLAQKDKEHLEKIRAALEAENPIKDSLVKNKRNNPNWNDTIKSELKIYSSKIYSDLGRFNITERKTFTLTFPEWISEHPLRHHFIRGYIDGDGCFSSSIGEDRGVRQVNFSVRGTSGFLTSLRAIFEADLNLDKRIKDIRINSGIGVLSYGGNRLCKKLAEYLYKDATIYLERKKKAAFAFENWDTKEYFEDKNISKEKLEEIYVKTKSICKTSAHLEVSRSTVYKYLLKYEIQIFESPQLKKKKMMDKITPELFKLSYENHGTIAGVAKEFGIGKTTAARYLKAIHIVN